MTDTDEPQLALLLDTGFPALTVDTDAPQPTLLAVSTFSVLAVTCGLVDTDETDEPQPTLLTDSTFSVLAVTCGLLDTDDTDEPQPTALVVTSTFSVLAVVDACGRVWALPTQTISGLSFTSAEAPQLALNLRPPVAECQPSPVDQPSSEVLSTVVVLSTDVDPTPPLFPPLPPLTLPTLETLELEELVLDSPDEEPSFPLLPPESETLSSVLA